MTTIAVRGDTMAGDSCWSDESCAISFTDKIRRLSSGALYASAGDADDRALVELLDGAATPDALPSQTALRALYKSLRVDLLALILFPSRALWRVEVGKKCREVIPIRAPFAAIGSGADFAMGAMAAGKSAVRAVQIVCDSGLDVYTRGPVTHLKISRKGN